MIGQIVGNYKILESLGEGGVGMVYKGVDTMLDREVAIKVLRPELASQTSVVERFRSEAVTLAKLSHPNIATLYSLFRHGDHLFMVLEYIKGETLDHFLYRRGRIPTDEAIPYFCQALEGINYAHERGIVHRDIKPGNMMLAEDGILKVLDFGIARLLGTNRMTRVGNVIGTLEYMSPEQVKGLDTDARSDVYGLGIMLYEILTGKLPFESENDFELMKMQTEMLPLPPRALVPDIPLEVEQALMKSVAKNPDERFTSAGDFLNTFLEMGYALPNMTLGFGTMQGYKKASRPSNPGLRSGETTPQTSEGVNPIPQSQIPTEPIISIPMPEVPINNELQSEAATVIKGTRLAPTNSEIKGTRLAPTNPNEIKATRLGEMSTDEVSVYPALQSKSFLDRLSWVHYAGASAALLVFFALAGMAIILPTIWGSDQPKAKEEPKKVELPKSVDTPKPEVVANPTPQPTMNQPTLIQPPTSQNPQLPSSTPINNEPSLIVSEKPASDKPNNPPSSQNQPKEKRPQQQETQRAKTPARQQPADNGGATNKPKPKKPSLGNILRDQ